MLADNTSEEIWSIIDPAQPSLQVGTNIDASNGPVVTRSGQKISLGLAPSNPGKPNLFVNELRSVVRVNLSNVTLPGKDFLFYAGPDPLPEKFGKGLPSIGRAYEAVRAKLVHDYPDFETSIVVSRDPEHLKSEALLIVVKVKGVPYNDMLAAWNSLSRTFAQQLGKSLMGKVHLVLRPGE